jgi:hypothetical protein
MDSTELEEGEGDSMTTDTPRTDTVGTQQERLLANALEKAIEMGANAEAEVERLKAQQHYHHESYCRKCKEAPPSKESFKP